MSSPINRQEETMILTGINPLQIDPGTALGVGNLFPPGIEIDDPRTGVFVGNRIKYVQVNATVTSLDATRLDFSVTAANRRFTVISTGAVTDRFEGYANNMGTVASVAQFSWIWITVAGFCAGVKNLNAGVAGSTLAASATAGTLTLSPSAAIADAIVVAGGRRAFALVTPSGNLGDVYIGG
jgi:hypothetical protein